MKTRGKKLTKQEVAFIKALFNRFYNDTQVQEIISEQLNKSVSTRHINHIRNGRRWSEIQPQEGIFTNNEIKSITINFS